MGWLFRLNVYPQILLIIAFLVMVDSKSTNDPSSPDLYGCDITSKLEYQCCAKVNVANNLPKACKYLLI